MGHVINPVSFRLSNNKFWQNKIVDYNFKNNVLNNIYKKNINIFLERFFNFKFFLKNGFLYSHSDLFYINNGYELNIYLYKTKGHNSFDMIVNDSSFFIINLVRTIDNKFNNFLNTYFKVLGLKLNFLRENKKFNNIYLIYLLKKFRFFSIHTFLNLIFNRFKFNFFLNKMLLMLLRKKFWNLIVIFLKFYIRPYVSNKVKIKILITSNISIDIIRKYIVIRLQQRFKISQIVSPIIKDLRSTEDVLGFKFLFSGRFSRREMATYEWFVDGAVPLNTIKVNIEYRQFTVLLKDGVCGIKIWINRKSSNINFFINETNLLYQM